MKNLICFTIFILIASYLNSNGQSTEKFDIVSYTEPSGWVKETGSDFIAYTISNNANNEYARILIFKSLQGTGNIDADFDTEWKELVQLNYRPESFINTTSGDFKEGWVTKTRVAPFKYNNQNHAVLLHTAVKSNIKMSSVFITNTVNYQVIYEDFTASMMFGSRLNAIIQPNNPPQQQVTSTASLGYSQVEKTNPTMASQVSGYTFTTSNFDDGWTSTIKKEYVLVEKGNAKIYLFYAIPYNADNFSGTGVMDRDYYWDNYVAGQFRTTSKQYNDVGEFISSFLPKYVEGRGTDPVSGIPAFVAMILSVAPNSAQLTVASFPDETSFRQAFPKANDKFTSDLAGMSRYNKFAIGNNDIAGTWQSGGSQMTQWYDAITGAYAGATIASSSAIFSFYNNGSYSSIQNGATGAVGAMNTFQQEYKGTCTVSNWNIVLTNRYQGKTHNFDAHYQAVRGGRLLYLNNNAGESYLLVRIR
jgi:hypothetical protein